MHCLWSCGSPLQLSKGEPHDHKQCTDQPSYDSEDFASQDNVCGFKNLEELYTMFVSSKAFMVKHHIPFGVFCNVWLSP